MSMEATFNGPAMEQALNTGKKKFAAYFEKKPLRSLLPDYGYAYFDHLKAEYEKPLIAGVQEKALGTIRQMNEKRNDSTLTWSDLYTYEAVFLRQLGLQALPRKIWDLRNRYRDIVGLKEYEAYLASKPPEISGHLVEEELRSDVDFLLNKIYLYYALRPFNEKLQNSIARKVTVMVLIGLALIILASLRHWLPIGALAEQELTGAPILMMLYAGAMGGLLSMLQRYSNYVREGDPISSIPIQYWTRIFNPAINGALFAALLYMFIMGGLLEGSFFPEIVGPPAGERIGLTGLLTEFRPKGGEAYAKLIVWGFIAGFAERFVPDTLSRFVSKKDKDQDNKPR